MKMVEKKRGRNKYMKREKESGKTINRSQKTRMQEKIRNRVRNKKRIARAMKEQRDKNNKIIKKENEENARIKNEFYSLTFYNLNFYTCIIVSYVLVLC